MKGIRDLVVGLLLGLTLGFLLCGVVAAGQEPAKEVKIAQTLFIIDRTKEDLVWVKTMYPSEFVMKLEQPAVFSKLPATMECGVYERGEVVTIGGTSKHIGTMSLKCGEIRMTVGTILFK